MAGLLVWFCALTMTPAGAGEPPKARTGPVPQAPPPAPPVGYRAPEPERPSPRPHGPMLYSIGDPTDEEQLFLEYINRSRADPPAEGARLANTTDPDVLSAYGFFSVDLTLMQSQFNAIGAAPPLAMNSQLLTAARLHSGHMFTNEYQGHIETNGTNLIDPGARITAQGYQWLTYGENVYATSKSVWYGHAGFNVDWGPGPGGMQSPPGHRQSIASSAFREVGVGVVDGTNGPVGPQLVTQDFGTRQSDTPLITGVVYYDFNTNNFYDPGEGIGGVTVDVVGSSYHAVTANSGGYAVPAPADGDYAVVFTGPGLVTHQVTASVSGLKNVKVDYLPVYAPPIISGPNPAGVNQTNLYSFTPVGAATLYQWEQSQLVPFTAVEGAENGLANATAVTSPGYQVIATDVTFAGNNSFHLAHPQPPTDQFLTLNSTLRAGAGSQLIFYSQLSWATTDEIAQAQVSTNNGNTWQEVWSQAGTDDMGESSFTQQTISLGGYANQQIQIRFFYAFTGGSYFPADSGVGLYLDNISVTDAEQLSDPIVTDVPAGTNFSFSPTNTGDYSLRVRARVSNHDLGWGPVYRVTSTNLSSGSLQFSGAPTLTGNQVQMDFDATNLRPGAVFQLLTAQDLDGAWTTNNSASFQTLVPNASFRVTTSNGGASRTFYRVQSD